MVAERAGVSAMTVSSTINDSGKVSQATRDRVRAAIEELGYKPNRAAQTLASAGSISVGTIFHSPENPFLGATLVGLLGAASARGAQVLIRRCDDYARATAVEALHAVVRSGANAVLVAPPFCELLSGTAAIAELGVPVAAVGCGVALPDMITARIDNHAAARSMTDLLIARGHRRIGFIKGPAAHSTSAQRYAGYATALHDHGIALDARLVFEGAFTFESGLAAAAHLLGLADAPSAIFAANDDMAAAVVSVAHRRGLAIPENLAIAGFDDSTIATKIWPSLTTIRQPSSEMAARATEMLISELRNPEWRACDEILPFDLIERASTAPGDTTP